MSDAIVLQGIRKTYKVPSLVPWKPAKTAVALRGVSFSCPRGAVSCLLGPNGAGKTTIIKVLGGLVLPDAGAAFIDGRAVTAASMKSRARLGVASPNERSFYWRLTGRQNLEFFASLHGLSGRERTAQVQEALDAVGIDREIADKHVRFYSSGMKQKLLIARALLGRPEVILLDEPSTHLDPLARIALHSFIRDYLVGQRGATVLLCTHDLDEAQQLAQHLVLLNEGEVLAAGTLHDLRLKLQAERRVVMEFIRPPDEGWLDGLPVTVLKAGNGTMELRVPDQGTIPDVINAATTSGGRLLGCTQQEEALVDVFARLTGGKS